MTTKSILRSSAGSAAAASALYRMPGILSEVETLKAIAIFCGASPVISLLLAIVDFDLSLGFF